MRDLSKVSVTPSTASACASDRAAETEDLPLAWGVSWLGTGTGRGMGGGGGGKDGDGEEEEGGET